MLFNLERKEITKNNWLALSSNVSNKKSFIWSRNKEGVLSHKLNVIIVALWEMKRGKICSQNIAHNVILLWAVTRLNLREKTINCTQYYKNQSEKHIRAQIRIIVSIYSENVFPHEADWSVVKCHTSHHLPLHLTCFKWKITQKL